MSTWEIVGFIFGIVSVWLTVKEHIGCWPTGIVSAAAYMGFFWQGHLYANMGLQAVIIGLYFYGWYAWRWGGTGGSGEVIAAMPRRALIAILLLGVPLTLLIGGYLKKFTTAPAIPWWDAGTAAYSMLAQYLQAKKWIENWPLWIVINAVYVGMFIQSHYWLTALLYAIFIPLAIAGWRAWKKALTHGLPMAGAGVTP